MPATLVNDPSLPDIVVRIRRNPYYILRREQYWDRTQCSGGDPCLYEHDGDIPPERFIVCYWVLVNLYTLLNMQREEVSRWTVIQYGVLVSDGYPRSWRCPPFHQLQSR